LRRSAVPEMRGDRSRLAEGQSIDIEGELLDPDRHVVTAE
jgi:hypothetical protein